ncbi:MAG: SOS response-associated peptidase [Armatimonadetes bacterium]|nr:SOS response-associated peptidase [Armatimonadota bacterium]
MCARYVFFSGKVFADAFGVLAVPDLTPRYNIAPTQMVPGVRLKDGERLYEEFRWGLIPSWAKDTGVGTQLINARAESLDEKPAFRSAFQSRRCLIAADGFYEWRGSAKARQAFYLTAFQHPFAFAGLYENWKGPDGWVRSCTIVTTSPNRLVEEIHDRMPVMLTPDEYDIWLDPDVPVGRLTPLLDAFPAEQMTVHEVDRAVGNPANEGPQLILPIGPSTLF